MTDTAVLTARLSEAEDALHQITIGGGTAMVKYDGREVMYTKADLNELKLYIRSLKVQLGLETPRRAKRVIYR